MVTDLQTDKYAELPSKLEVLLDRDSLVAVQQRAVQDTACMSQKNSIIENLNPKFQKLICLKLACLVT